LDNEKKRHAKTTTSRNAILKIRRACTRVDTIGNEDIYKEIRMFSINGRIRRYTQNGLQHVERMKEGRVPKQALWYRPKGRRNPDRPPRRWNS
jgi:hypothetical protein